MTSRNLFFKLQKEDLKRRIWAIALTALVFFVSLPLCYAIRLGDYAADSKPGTAEIYEFAINHSVFLMLVTAAAAVICGLSGFFYLHSRKKVDLYHSIPVRRELLFAVRYADGLAIYVLPYIVNLVISLGLLKANGLLSGRISDAMLMAAGINLLFYCLIYTIVIIAVMLTGNLAVSILGTAVFFVYGPMLVLLKELYFMSFFATFYLDNRIFSKMTFLSPFVVYYETMNDVLSGDAGSGRAGVLRAAAALAILFAVAVILYRKRPSEAAGKAMVFEKSRLWIKFLISVPVSLGGGIFFKEITDSRSWGWYVFGVVFTLFIVYMIIETIFYFDIRSVFTRKKHFAICAAAVAAILSIFRFDIFNYDSYIPKESSVESMSITVDGLDENIQYTIYRHYLGNGYYSNGGEYELEYMELADFKAAYELAGLGVEYVKQNDVMKNGFVSNYTYAAGSVSDERLYSFDVKFRLKNGNEVYRKYSVKEEDGAALLEEIYGDEAFKKVHYPIYQYKAADIRKITCRNQIEDKELSLSLVEKKEFLRVYREELTSLSLKEATGSFPVASVMFEIYDEKLDFNIGGDYYIYPQFEKTMAFLESHGFDAEKEKGTVTELTIFNNHNMQETVYSSVKYNSSSIENGKSAGSAVYTDEDQIEAIMSCLVPSEYYWNNASFFDIEEGVDVSTVTAVDEYGNNIYASFYFEKGKIPEFVIQDIGYAE